MPKPSKLVDDLIAKIPDWRGEALARLRKIIFEADPEIAEDVKWRRPANPLGVAVWEHEHNLARAKPAKARKSKK
jgi:hypothetical protein